MGRREKLKEEKRKKILAAAKEVFLEKGYQSASISDILRKTDLARGTFYLYFQSKQEIFDGMLFELFMAINNDIYRLNIESWKNTTEVYREVVLLAQSLFKILGQNQELVRIVLGTPVGLDNEFDRKVAGYHTLMLSVITGMLKRAIQSLKITSVDARLFAHLIYGGIKEVVFQWLVNQEYKDVDAEIEQIVSIYMNGIDFPPQVR